MFETQLSNNDFWLRAFDTSAAFAPEARIEFRRGLMSGGIDDLAWARLVLPATTDHGLWPITGRLLELASATPNAEFVEPVVLFITNAKVLDRLRAQMPSMTREGRNEVLEHASQLFLALKGSRDPWADKYAESLRLLQLAASED